MLSLHLPRQAATGFWLRSCVDVVEDEDAGCFELFELVMQDEPNDDEVLLAFRAVEC